MSLEKNKKTFAKPLDKMPRVWYNISVIKREENTTMFKKIINVIVFVLTGKGEIADEAVREGIISYEGQGRDKFGR